MFKYINDLFFKNKDYYTIIEKTSKIAVIIHLVLLIIKIVVGITTFSLTIIGDAINSLSDFITSLLAVFSSYIIRKPADKEHPYGHGRVEYIVSFIVGVVMIILAYELFKSSFNNINNSNLKNISVFAVLLIVVSIILKLVLFYIYRLGYQKSNSLVLKLSSQDAFNDLLLSTAALFSLLIKRILDINVDAYFAMIFSIYIVFASYQLIKETIDNLIGKKIDTKDIKNYILNFSEIEEVHDFNIHQYGAMYKFGICDVVMKEVDYLKIHNLIDHIEYQIKKRYGIEMRIHVDPYETLNQELLDIVFSVNNKLKAHDFYIEHKTKKISFDLVSLWDNENIEKDKKEIIVRIKEKYPNYTVIINVDYENET